MDVLRRVERGIAFVCRYSAVVFGLIMIVSAFLQVVMRFVVNDPLTWSEALCRYSLVWFVFMSIGWGVKVGAHVRVDIILTMSSKKFAYWLNKFVDVVTVIFAVVLGYTGAMKMLSQWNQITPSLHISYGWIYLAVPLGCLIMLFYALLQLFGLREKL